jgi:hypothetical protein
MRNKVGADFLLEDSRLRPAVRRRDKSAAGDGCGVGSWGLVLDTDEVDHLALATLSDAPANGCPFARANRFGADDRGSLGLVSENGGLAGSRPAVPVGLLLEVHRQLAEGAESRASGTVRVPPRMLGAEARLRIVFSCIRFTSC